MSEKMVLVLTLDAMERLIGNNPEIEVALKQCVVNTLVKRHVKAEFDEKIERSVRQIAVQYQHQIDQQVKESFEKRGVSLDRYSVTLNDDIKKTIKERVEIEIGDVVNSYYNSIDLPGKLDEEWKKLVDDFTKLHATLNDKISEHIQALLAKKIG